MLFSGFGGKSGVSAVVLENVSSERKPRNSVSNELFPVCLAILTHINNPVLRGHRPHPPELIGVFAYEGLIQLILNLRDLLVRWRFVVHRAVEMAAVLLLLGCALYAFLAELLPVEAPWLSCDENRGREVSRAHLNDDGTVNIKRSLSVNATSRDGARTKSLLVNFLAPCAVHVGWHRWLLIGAGRLATSGHPRCVMSFLTAGLLSISVLKSPNIIFGPIPEVSNSCCAAAINLSVLFLLFVLFAAPCHPYKLTTIYAVDDPISML